MPNGRPWGVLFRQRILCRSDSVLRPSSLRPESGAEGKLLSMLNGAFVRPAQQLHSAGPADTTAAVWERNGNEMLAPPKKFCFFPLKLQRNSGNWRVTLPIKQYFPASKSQRSQKWKKFHKVKLKYGLDGHIIGWTFYRLVTFQNRTKACW